MAELTEGGLTGILRDRRVFLTRCVGCVMDDRLHDLLDVALAGPVIGQVRARRFDRFFRSGMVPGACRGVYQTFAEAAAAAPRTKPLGYDHESAGELYPERLGQVYPGDYPMMLWLTKAFADGVTRVFDLGGHVGVSYYAYQPYVRYPTELQWAINDVPAVAERGRAIAAARDHRRALSFVPTFDSASGADLLFTSGCLQYLEESLPMMLSRLEVRPTWVLINLVPMHAKSDYWTVQSIQDAFCPYHIQRDAAFFEAMRALGYDLLDRWVNAEKRCAVQFRPELTVDGYVGAAFRLSATG
jgi:putative methyltransferase (TIGR04325 family)